MLDLSDKSLAAWMSQLPNDVRALIAAGEAPSPGGAVDLSAALSNVEPVEVPAIVREHANAARALGRAGRLRLTAWMAARGGENPGPALRRLVGETPVSEASDSEEESGGSVGADEVGLLFLEDIRAFIETVVGPRAARRIVDAQSLEMAAEAAFTLESDIAFKQGGV